MKIKCNKCDKEAEFRFQNRQKVKALCLDCYFIALEKQSEAKTKALNKLKALEKQYSSQELPKC